MKSLHGTVSDQAIFDVANCMHVVVVLAITSFISFPRNSKLLMISVPTEYTDLYYTHINAMKLVMSR